MNRPRRFPNLTGPYLGQTPPTDKPLLFAPGIVSDGQNHSSVAISPDGEELYWSSGAKGAGMKIWFTQVVRDRWTQPQVVPFCGEDADDYDNPFVTPDGSKLFFTTTRPGAVSQKKETIWYADRAPSGWSDPKPVGPKVNELPVHWSISVSGAGTLYFPFQNANGELPGGLGAIYSSRWVNGAYTEPVSLGPAINTPATETCPHIAPDESYVVFTRFDMTNPNNTGIFISYRDESGSWLPAVMAEGGSRERGGLSPRISPDGKYLFYVSAGVWWMPAGFIEALRPQRNL